MKRFLSTLAWDIRRQFRYGFYYVSLFVAVMFILLLKQFLNVEWARMWPPTVLENLIVNSFYFVAGLVLLEKGEGTLEAQVVTPLRPYEYLFSKAASLGLLSLLETLLMVVLVSGPVFKWHLMIPGVLLLVTMYTFYGFFVVTRYDSINEFLMPSALWTLGFSLPFLYYFHIWRTPVMFLHPLQAPLVIIQAAFETIPAWQLLYGVLYSLLWVGIGFLVSRRAFHRFVIRKEGRRKR